jgi:hypothetical protein
MSAMIVEAFVTETDEMFTHVDRALSSRVPAGSMAVFDEEIAIAEPAGEMPMAFWP